MSRSLGDVGDNGVSRFTGPEGRRESYQLTPVEEDARCVVFTYEEFQRISALIEAAHSEPITFLDQDASSRAANRR